MNITWWLWAMIAVSALLFIIGVLIRLHEHGVRPLREATRLVRRPWFEGLLLLVCVGGLVQYGATKGFQGGPRLMAPRGVLTELHSGPDVVVVTDGMFPVYTNAVTNLCLSGVMPAATSVFLRAHWPWDLNPAPTGIEVYAAPELLTNVWFGVGTAPVTGGDSSMVVELPYSLLPDGWPRAMFFTLGLDVDSDHDGLSDVFEDLVSKTDPDLADTDGDGLDDGWEAGCGTDPLADDANDDPDQDGLPNVWERYNGTDPHDEDADGDMLADGLECGWIEDGVTNIPWFAVQPILTYAPAANTDRALIGCAMPFTNRLAGCRVDTALADVNGVVYFGRPDTTNGVSSSDSGLDLAVAKNRLCATVAAYWTNLRMYPARGSSITFGTAVMDAANRFFVVEYCDIGTSSGSGNNISLQLSIPEAEPDVVYVRYGEITDTRANIRVSIGAQGAKVGKCANTPLLSRYCQNRPPAIEAGQTVAFHFGAGSDPLAADTDGDGLDDRVEFGIGTNPRAPDTDGDSLSDDWEVGHGLDPLLATGDDGASGDFDRDGLMNADEYAHGTNPALVDTDGDGLSDLTELGGVTVGSLPWLQFETQTNLTASFEYAYGSVVTWPLPEPIYLHGVCVTEVTVDSNGLAYFNRKGTRRTGSAGGESRMTDSWTVCADSFTVAPFWDYLYLTEEAPASVISAGTAISGTNRYFVIQYDGVCPYDNRTRQGVTNSVSWQLAVPYGDAERMYVRYENQIGTTDGRWASIGYQDFDGARKVSYCYHEAGRIFDGAAVSFAVGVGTDPLDADTFGDGAGDYSVYQSQVDPSTHDADGDGLTDGEERTLGTSLVSADTDGDGMPDRWEVEYGLDPCVAAETDVDADNDGLTNLEESRFWSDPHSADTDGDGIDDGDEIGLGTSMTNADTDNDGLGDGIELAIGTNPLQPDTDGDGMDDGWEWAYCRRARMPRLLADGDRTMPDFDPAVNNDNDTDPDNDFGADPDVDGLSNGNECENRTDPTNPDTDGDEVTDGNEVGQGSDPSDATDGGRPNSRVAVQFTFGDPSESHSEKYRLVITPVSGQGERPASFSWLNANYGECETRTARLKAGWKYEVRLTWAACNHASDGSYYPNYDYTLSMGQDIPPGVVLDDPGGIFRTDYYGGEYYGASHFPVLDAVAYVYVLGPMRLVPDFDGDGRIGQTDENILEDGRAFRFWVNDDKDDASSDGDVARNSKILDGGNDDIPASGSDGSDDKVNGRRDLVDFTPIRVDVLRTIGDLPEDIRDKFSFRLRQEDGAVNVVWSNLSPLSANSFQTVGYASGFGGELSSSPQEAATEQVISGGLPLPPAFEDAARAGEGIFLVEGRHETTNPLVIEAIYENRVVCSNELRLSVTSVEDMYRWLGLRHVCGDQDLAGHSTTEPANLPDGETTGPHYVFVHGYNVNVQSARGWAAEMFKRLWQAGARSKFTAVDWYGDESQLWAGVPIAGGESLDYYVNVRHALDTAQHLQAMLSGLPGEKVMMAHSLGNMLVSEAAVRYGLVYSKYYMLNAAVPMEAYDSDVENVEMREHGWTDVPPTKWAANWHTRIPYENDPRRTLKWKGRFAGIDNAINCFSPTEDVLGNATNNWYGGEWSIQELYKGTAALHFIPGNCEGGWGYNSEHTNLAGFLTDFAKTNEFTDAELVASPVFRKFDNELLHQTNRITIAQTELNKVLGDGIPALSFAAGANETGGVADNYNYNSYMANVESWPRFSRENGVKQLLWHHSDIKNIAYYFVYPFFEQLVSEGD